MLQVHHKTYGSSSSQEALAAERLKEHFEVLPCEGSVLIASNVTLPGGNTVKDLDIVIAGYLKNCFLEEFEYPSTFSGYRADKKGLEVQSFLVVIELKDFSISQIQVSETGIITGRYASGGDKNITKQSFEQKFALRNVLNTYKKLNPYTYHLIWLEGIEKQDFVDQFGKHDEWNVLTGEIDAYDLLRAIAFNGERAICKDDCYLINSFSKVDACNEVLSVFELFLLSKTSMGNLTRHKVEAISQGESYQGTLILPGQITVLRGRAGTGKTIRLLQFAYRQIQTGKKCVFLTYNHALVSDIQRLIAFSDFSSAENENLSVQTMIQFFSEIMKQYGIDNAYEEEYFEQLYNSRLHELNSKILSKNDCGWDYVLVDEAQDWSQNEINVLLSLFRPEQIVIADGVDQFVRSIPNSPWDVANLNKTELQKSLRQESNLVSFVNAFAAAADIVQWNVEPNTNLKGGRVIITPVINKELLNELKHDCLEKNNAMYDILFLVNSTISRPEYMAQLLPAWEKMGFPLFDGTSKKNREYYSIDVNESRIFNFNSCRGLEGWTVVCLDIDMLVDEKLRSMVFPPLRHGETELDRQVRIWKQVCLWVLMPLTRAIDTLVISLRNPNSKVGQLFYELSRKLDFVEWRFPN